MAKSVKRSPRAAISHSTAPSHTRGRRHRRPAVGSRSNWWLGGTLVALGLLNLYVFLLRDGTSVPDVMQAAVAPPVVAAAVTMPPTDVPLSARISDKVTAGDSMGRVLRRMNLTANEADELIRALSTATDIGKVMPGQAISIVRGANGTVDSCELIVSKTQTIRVVRGGDGKLVGISDLAATRLVTEAVGGTIESSLHAAAKGAGEDGRLVGFFVDVFAYDLDFYNDTHRGDTFRVVVEKEYLGDEFLRYKRILAAEYAGKAGTFRVLRYQPASGEAKYYTEKGESVERSLLKTPLKFARISSKFDRKRMHPVLHRVRAHLGTDYAAPVGTPVWAAAPGKIVSRGPAGGAGNLVTLQHNNGLQTLYMHLNRFAAGQKVGDRVDAKTVIGYVGTTGLSTGPHLHFGVKKNGVFIDPAKLASTRGPRIAKADEGAFSVQAEALLAQLANAATTPLRASSAADDEPAAGAEVDWE